MEKITAIKKWLKKKRYSYVDIPEKSIDKIYDLLFYNIYIEPNESTEYLYFGLYCDYQEDYDKMMELYQKAIDYGNTWAMINLGWYYCYLCNDHKSALKYYNMAIDLGNHIAFCKIGKYYEYQNDYTNMKKYYKIAIKLGCVQAMEELAVYHNARKNYAKTEKYYLMAIESGSLCSMNNLAYHYREVGDKDNMVKYYLMAIDRGYKVSMFNLGHYYCSVQDYDSMLEYLLPAIAKKYKKAIKNLSLCISQKRLSARHYVRIADYLDYETYAILVENDVLLLLFYRTYRSKIELLELPFKYSPDNEGFMEAKEDFVQNLNNN